jgi:hypothetical protein
MTAFSHMGQLLASVVGGDLSDLAQLLCVDHACMEEAGHQVAPLVLTGTSVLRVLVALQTGRLDPGMAQQWASLMKRGFVGRASGGLPVRPLKIEYELSFEEPISVALSRLDELGDSVDGEIDRQELTQLMAMFQ